MRTTAQDHDTGSDRWLSRTKSQRFFHREQGGGPFLTIGISTDGLSREDEVSLVRYTLERLTEFSPDTFEEESKGYGPLFVPAAQKALDTAICHAYRQLQRNRVTEGKSSVGGRVLPLSGESDSSHKTGFKFPGRLNDYPLVVETSGKENKFAPLLGLDSGVSSEDQAQKAIIRFAHSPVTLVHDDETGENSLIFHRSVKDCAGKTYQLLPHVAASLLEALEADLHSEDLAEDFRRLEYTEGVLPPTIAERVERVSTSWLKEAGLTCDELGRTDSPIAIPFNTREEVLSAPRTTTKVKVYHLRGGPLTQEDMSLGARQKGKDLLNGVDILGTHPEGGKRLKDHTRNVM